MPIEDISRSAFSAARRYRGVRMQQGRVLTDDDWNSQDDVVADDVRETRLHVIGPAGTPDDGFRMTDVAIDGDSVDFELQAGTYYVSGHRVTLPEPIRYAEQPDWLDRPADEPPAPDAERTDLVYLEVWEQPVTAVEDGELLEKALGGPDTTTRRRLMARVRVLPGVAADDCHEAWAVLAGVLETADRGTLGEDGELVPDLTLTVSYAESGEPEDLCTPSVTAGYLGAENQAIRVQLVAGALLWGYDAGAPLYRATIDAAGTVLTFLDQPKDAVHWPLAGQTIEVLRPAATLANGEVLAALSGHLTTVAASYDPTSTEVTLTDAHPDAAELAGLDHVFVRMWRRGTDLSSDPAEPVTPGDAIDLGNTGVTVTVDGDDLGADAFWVIAVRPETPDQVVPWDLETGRAPHGVRRFYAPIGLVRWVTDGDGELVAEVEDCRPPFAPLTAQRGCCRYTVGDGTASHGQFASIQEAIDLLPPSGGEICLLPGTFEENVVLDGRTGVSIHGCGPRTLVEPLDPTLPTFALRTCSDVRLASFAIANPEAVAIEIASDGAKVGISDAITLHDLDVDARDRAAIVALAVTRFTLTDCRVRIQALDRDVGGDDVGAWPAVFVLAADARIEGNRIETNTGETVPTDAEGPVPSRTALGGLQIGGQSERVDVLRNRITGGLGHGITLGHVEWVAAPEDPPSSPFAGGLSVGVLVFVPPYVVSDCCPELTPVPPGPSDDDVPLVPISGGDLEDVRIVDNEIDGMGANGIGVARFFPLDDDFESVHVDRLTIERNRIHDNTWLEVAAAPADEVGLRGWGGIALATATALDVRGNRILRNGAATPDPTCGVFVLLVEHLLLEDNEIADNGRRLVAGDALDPGYRGAVVVVIAETAVSTDGTDDDLPAARIVDNIVRSPDGPALWLGAIGPVAVHANHLATLGRSAAVSDALAAANGEAPGDLTSVFALGVAVRLVDLAEANDTSDETSAHFSEDLAVSSMSANGSVLFDDNQVTLDLRPGDAAAPLAAVLLLSQDDLQVDGNHFAVEMSAEDAILGNVVAASATLRVTDNRFEERLRAAQVSALTYASLNTTTDNQGTHCIVVVGLTAGKVDQPNRTWIELYDPDYCGRVQALADKASNALDDAFSARNPDPGGAYKYRPADRVEGGVRPVPADYLNDPLR